MSTILEKIFKTNTKNLGQIKPLKKSVLTKRKTINEVKSELLIEIEEINKENWKESFSLISTKINKFKENIKKDFLLLGMDFSLLNPNADRHSYFSSVVSPIEYPSLRSPKKVIGDRVECLKNDMINVIKNFNVHIACVKCGCGCVKYNGDLATFKCHSVKTVTSKDKQKDILVAHNVGYVDHSLKDPDDFTRSVPKKVNELLKKLNRTNYDYLPKILDGYLAFHEVDEIVVSTLQYDPALTIEVDSKNRIVIDFWETSEKSLLELNEKVGSFIDRINASWPHYNGYKNSLFGH